METQTSKSPHTLFWIAGIAVTVFSVAGIAAIMGWIPTSTSSPTDSAALAKQSAAPAKPAAARARAAPEQERRREVARGSPLWPYSGASTPP